MLFHKKNLVFEVRLLLDNIPAQEFSHGIEMSRDTNHLKCMVPVRAGQMVAIEYCFAGLNEASLMDMKIDGIYRAHRKHSEFNKQQCVDSAVCRMGDSIYRSQMVVLPYDSNRIGDWTEIGTVSVDFHLASGGKRFLPPPGRSFDNDHQLSISAPSTTSRNVQYAGMPNCLVQFLRSPRPVPTLEAKTLRRCFHAARSQLPFVTFTFHYREEGIQPMLGLMAAAARSAHATRPAARMSVTTLQNSLVPHHRVTSLHDPRRKESTRTGVFDNSLTKLEREVSDEEYAALLTYIDLPAEVSHCQPKPEAATTPSSPEKVTLKVDNTRKRTAEEMEEEAALLQAKAAALLSQAKRLKGTPAE